MKIQDQHVGIVEIEGEQDVANFSVSKDDQAHILSILRDKLYSDKVSAVLREYGTNALDANPAGVPIEIILPAWTSPQLKIRDFGPGLSKDDVKTIYTQYGRSTKRESNSAIGQLGLGCKSGFAYSSQFTVTSWHGGTKTIYNAYIDETNEGRMSVFHTEPSDEPTGVEISIPVKAEDINEFKTKAINVYYYFEPRPKINIEIPRPEYVIQSGWWRIRKEQRGYNYTPLSPKAIMGSIAYPLSSQLITGLPENLSAILSLPIEIRFDIGELSISANRESLEYTPTTIENIKRRLTTVEKALVAKISSYFESCKTIYEARKLFYKLLSDNNSDSFARILKPWSVWNNINLNKLGNTSLRSFLPTGSAQAKAEKYRVAGGEVVKLKWGNIEISENTTIFINDVTSAHLKRVSEYYRINNQSGAAVLVQGLVDQELADALARNHLTGIPVVKLSSVPFDRKAIPDLVIQDERRSKAFKKIFKLTSPTNRYPLSDNWSLIEDPASIPKNPVYLDIYNFDNFDGRSLGEYQELIYRTLPNLNPNYVVPVIIGLKVSKGLKEPAPKDWIPLETYVTEQVKALFTQKDIQALSKQRFIWPDNIESPISASVMKNIIDICSKHGIVLPREFANYFAEVAKLATSEPIPYSKIKLSQFIDSAIPKYDISNLLETRAKMIENYPITALFVELSPYFNTANMSQSQEERALKIINTFLIKNNEKQEVKNEVSPSL